MSSRLEWHGERVLALIEAAAARGIGDGADMVAETSQDRVPEMTGELKRSQHVAKDGTSASIYYTDSKAAAAHENLTVNYRRGRQAKFLESAANDQRDDIVATLAEHIKGVLE